METDTTAAHHQNPFEFDLIYAPRTWQTLFHHWEALAPYDLLYVHTGGLEGTASQLQRYARLNPRPPTKQGVVLTWKQ
jgi:1-aminocyclopropane-1-carboxylate deaminase/D-cysteine desulfhydrase-like pyridoxal-dependent ACC family enzyme